MENINKLITNWVEYNTKMITLTYDFWKLQKEIASKAPDIWKKQ